LPMMRSNASRIRMHSAHDGLTPKAVARPLPSSRRKRHEPRQNFSTQGRSSISHAQASRFWRQKL
jgi:hypothetical protein